MLTSIAHKNIDTDTSPQLASFLILPTILSIVLVHDVMEMFLETIKACTGLMYPNPSPAHNYIHGCKNSTSAGPLQLHFLSHMLDL